MLKIIKFLNKSTTEIQAEFSDELDPRITVSNVQVLSNIPNIPDLSVIAISIDGQVITINVSPQFPLAIYTLSFINTDTQNFISVNGDLLQENNIFSQAQFVGLERENQIRTDIIDALPAYNTDTDTLVRKQISNLAGQLLKTRTDIRETGNANYISVDVADEVHTRGFGPTDRLTNEGTYKITRVARTLTGSTERAQVVFNTSRAAVLVGQADLNQASTQIQSFGSDPISLKSISVINEIVSNAEVINNRFESLLLTLSKQNVIQLHSVILRKANGDETTYPLQQYGYAIADNRYDTVHGRKLLTLDSNQIRLSDAAVISNDFIVPGNNDEFIVSYAYINNGINVEADSIIVSQVRSVVREPIGAFQTVFNLKNFPIVGSDGSVITSDGVSFLDPAPEAGQPYVETHRAFLEELPFDAARLPAFPGEYSVDYNSGQVFVYGKTTPNGTGSSAPVATYFYNKIFVNGIDFNFDSDTDEISGNSTRNLIGQQVSVNYNFETVLAENIDFIKEDHIEVLDERVSNRLLSAFKIATEHYPITNVFRIFNETTGEFYSPLVATENYITFSGRNAPAVKTQTNELARFARVSGELLLINEVLAANSLIQIISIDLTHNQLLSDSADSIGSSINNSIIFSKPDIFIKEFFYDDILQDISANLNKITQVGDYLVNYNDGIVYVITDADTSDLGNISYNYSEIDTIFSNILSPDTLSYKVNNNSDPVIVVDTPSFNAETIIPDSLTRSPERFLNNNTGKPIILGSKQTGVAGVRMLGSDIFVAQDAIFTTSVADGNHIIRFPDDADREIIAFISPTAVQVDYPFSDTNTSAEWYLIDFDFSDGYTAITTYDIQSIRSIYSVIELNSLPASELTNLYDPATDTVSGNLITFNNQAIKQIEAGTALAIDYSFGNIYIDYTYLADNLLVSYEYGDNSLNFSISQTLNAGDRYFASYSYGALRESLVSNFGVLTQIDELSSLPLEFNRELYRSGVSGALQAFVKGPTVDAIKTAVSSITGVDPDIRELTFNEWTIGRDNIYLSDVKLDGEEKYDYGRFGFGLVIDGDTTVSLPAESYISLRDGTFEADIRPNWRGLDNDATLTFDIGQDGYQAGAHPDRRDGYGLADGYTLELTDIYIGSSGFNPETIPFSINRTDESPSSPVGRPDNFSTAPGIFVWYNEDDNEWSLRTVSDPVVPINFTGIITTSGQFYNVRDGYDDQLGVFFTETFDDLTSTENYIRFNTHIDGYDSTGADGYIGLDGYDGYGIYDGYDGYFFQDGVDFLSDNLHYIIDTGSEAAQNRISVFKDGSGYLNLQVYDRDGRLYNISSNISDWLAQELHSIAASWRLNSVEGVDELHLFIDGQEVSNNFKYGGRPAVQPGDIYRTVASEVISSSAPKNIFKESDGISVAGSNLFVSDTGDFISRGVVSGDTLSILDNTIDGTSGPYSIIAIPSSNTIQISASLMLNLTGINYSINQLSATTETLLDIEKFIVLVDDGYEITELNGLNSDDPDYSIEKSGLDNIININNGVDAGNIVSIQTLGLTRGRCRDIIYNYRSDNILKTNLEPPADLEDVEIFEVIGKRASIVADGYFNPGDGYGDGIWIASGDQLLGNFTNLCQPTNSVVGKTIKFILGGTDNIDFSGINKVIISGTSNSTPTTETIFFADYGSEVSVNRYTALTSFNFTFTANDISESLGSLEIIENISLTVSEAGGNRAQVSRYDNGNFILLVAGSGGVPFNLEPCYYLIDFPTRLSININKKGKLYIGSDIFGNNQFNGILDEVLTLNEKLTDIRAGEIPGPDIRTITSDYNSLSAPTATAQTLLMLHFNSNLDNVDKIYTTFDSDILTSSQSVNANFGDCAVFFNNDPQIVENADTLIDNDTGTIEMWISPYIDILNDTHHVRYYMDAAAASMENATSITHTTVILTKRAKEIISVRLETDTGNGTDFFIDGELGSDKKTITLGARLPSTQTRLVIKYISLDQNGDRISIYKDGYGSAVFEIKAGANVFQISNPITWKRNTWHRIMVSWDLNNPDNIDKMRMFVDGIEGGSLTYGSAGLIYGTGIIYGSVAIGGPTPGFLATNIDLTDMFGRIFIGNNFDSTGSSMAKVDNVRFSNIVRQPATVANIAFDLNFNSNTEAVLPVLDDNNTTAIFDYDRDAEITEFLSNVLSETTPLFTFDVNVIDSFDKIKDNDTAKKLITDIINRIKPAHTSALVKFLD